MADDTDDDTEADRASRVLAARSWAGGDPTGWFEELYSSAARGEAQVPWDREYATATMVSWFESTAAGRLSGRAVVVGCGYGRDAEYLAGRGFATVAFDVAETAVQTAIERHPGSPVDYVTADLLNPPPDWRHRFDVVFESTTVQSLPIAVHEQAIRAVADLVAPDGTLLVVASAREATHDPAGPPWPLTRSEIDAFAAGGLQTVEVEDLDTGGPSDRRWRAVFRRPAVQS